VEQKVKNEGGTGVTEARGGKKTETLKGFHGVLTTPREGEYSDRGGKTRKTTQRK